MWNALVSMIGNLVPGEGGLQLFAGITEAVFNYRMWRSIGWLLLGILLMIIGFVVWNRKAIGGAAKTAATAAVL